MQLVWTILTMNSATTPYGNLMNFSPEKYPGVPFKGVTHGQFMFTKVRHVCFMLGMLSDKTCSSTL